MGAANASRGRKCQATVAEQSIRLLDELAALGLYGRNRGDVAGRFIEDALKKLTKRPQLKQRRTGTIPRGKIRPAQAKLTLGRRKRGRA